MKAKITPVTALRVTMPSFNTVTGKWTTSSKICHKAETAAEHYCISRMHAWWTTKDHRHQSNAIAIGHAREHRLFRRVLKVFKKYLP